MGKRQVSGVRRHAQRLVHAAFVVLVVLFSYLFALGIKNRSGWTPKLGIFSTRFQVRQSTLAISGSFPDMASAINLTRLVLEKRMVDKSLLVQNDEEALSIQRQRSRLCFWFGFPCPSSERQPTRAAIVSF